MAILAGIFKPSGEAANFPDAFVIRTETGPGLLATTGDPVPDSTGQYAYYDVRLDKPRYQRTDAAFQIWWSPPVNKWTMGIAPMETGGNRWRKADPVTGTYEPEGTYTGNPVVAVIPVMTLRRRIHGRRHGSGARRGYYEAGPGWEAGIYEASPAQLRCRHNFGAVLRQYMDFTTMMPVFITGEITPDITGAYGGIDLVNNAYHWYNPDHDWHLWWHGALFGWYLADTFPDSPVGGGPYWNRFDADPMGDYVPHEGAVGVAHVAEP